MPELTTNFKSNELCKTCGHIVWVKPDTTTTCSPDCKSPIFRKRIILKCDGCNKKFSILPYLKRKSNYCSMKCYWDSTRHKEKRFCKVCGNEFWPTKPQLNKGFGIFCSRTCQHKTYPPRIIKYCKQCNKRIEVQPSKVSLTKFCSKNCADSYMRDYADCICKNCHKNFQIPRWELNKGKGTFCSRPCFNHYKGESSLEEKMRKLLTKAKIDFQQEHKFGRFHADFLIEKLKLVIECDGEYWHMPSKNQIRDKRKDKYLKNLGYKVLRFSGQQIQHLNSKQLLTLL